MPLRGISRLLTTLLAALLGAGMLAASAAAARTDMGVDWLPAHRLPVLAVGDAVILGSNPNNTGWPGHHIIWYQLLDGTHAGDVIYGQST
jgi:peptidoglycan/LPS O-acetylase OafA/YrhL